MNGVVVCKAILIKPRNLRTKFYKISKLEGFEIHFCQLENISLCKKRISIHSKLVVEGFPTIIIGPRFKAHNSLFKIIAKAISM